MATLLALLTMAGAERPQARATAWPVRGLIQNEDETNFFYFRRIAAGVDGGAMVDQYVDNLADAGVDILMCNTNARRTNYRSQVWDAYWDGLDPNGPDDQPFLRPMAPEEIGPFRQMVESMRNLHNQGVDYPARVAARCRKHGISPWISLRMNDVHNNDVLDHPFHGRFWWEHPEFFRKGASGYFANALDYAHPEVREYYRRLIEESLTRYDVDGLEMDFMREPYVFSVGKEAEGAALLTEWLRGIRELARAAAVRWRHPVRLGVRVPSRPETCKAMGLDAVAWAREGLVDLVVPTPRWDTLEFDMPIAEWRALLRPFRKVMLAGGLEIRYRPHPGYPASLLRPEHAHAAAAAIWEGGAHAVYLFNYFQDSTWPLETYKQLLRTLGSRERVARSPRWHALTFRDIIGPGEEYRPPLPATGTRLEFDLPACPAPARGWKAQVVLGIEAPEGGQVQVPAVTVNGKACALERVERPAGSPTAATFGVPLAALSRRSRAAISVQASNANPIRVVSVELHVEP